MGCSWEQEPVYLVPAAGGRGQAYASVHGGRVRVQFASKLQAGLPSEHEAPGRGRGVRWHLGGTTSAECL